MDPYNSSNEAFNQLAQTQLQFLPSSFPTSSYSQSIHFKITVVRSSIDLTTQPTEFVVYKTGMENSPRFPQDGFVNIGRQQVNEHGQRPNDIMLPPSDRAISRCHCRLFYPNWFKERDLPTEYVAFLMASHHRLGKDSIFNPLPSHLFYYIYSFLKPSYTLWLSDLGSICGTYIRVANDIPVELQQGQSFLIGSDIIIDIDEAYSYPLQNLTSESSEECMMLTNMKNMHQPNIKITVGRIPDNEDATVSRHSQVFLAEHSEHCFCIGRSNNCDIKLNDSTISRTQCRVAYSRDRWYMYDGVDGKPSVNGTWMSISRRDRKVREESPAVEVQNGTQIKISETVLMLTWEN